MIPLLVRASLTMRLLKLGAALLFGVMVLLDGCTAPAILLLPMQGNGPVVAPRPAPAPGQPGQPQPFPLPDVPIPSNPSIGPGFVSDHDRFLLAQAAGWSGIDAITGLPNLILAVAVSIAEDVSGDPAARSAPNFDNSIDLGLWQINSVHWSSCGGPAALVIPINNARCAFGIWAASRSWCPWSTFGDQATCHVRGHNNAYLAFLPRARAAAQGG